MRRLRSRAKLFATTPIMKYLNSTTRKAGGLPHLTGNPGSCYKYITFRRLMSAWLTLQLCPANNDHPSTRAAALRDTNTTTKNRPKTEVPFCQFTTMSDDGQPEAPSLSAPSSDTVSVDGTSLHSNSSTRSGSMASSTTVCWMPSGLSGRLLQALGPGTVDLVTRFTIKRRLSSISSQIRMRSDKSLSENETESLGVAYRDLVELSS